MASSTGRFPIYFFVAWQWKRSILLTPNVFIIIFYRFTQRRHGRLSSLINGLRWFRRRAWPELSGDYLKTYKISTLEIKTATQAMSLQLTLGQRNGWTRLTKISQSLTAARESPRTVSGGGHCHEKFVVVLSSFASTLLGDTVLKLCKNIG